MSKVSFQYSHDLDQTFQTTLKSTQSSLQDFMEKEGIDAIIISSQDAFLSEYNALTNNQRYAVSDFKGSTGDGIFLSRKLCKVLGKTAPFILFVDGRYHLQADKECDPRFVEVVKMTIKDTLENKLELGIRTLIDAPAEAKVIAIDGLRSTLSRSNAYKSIASEMGFELRVLQEGEIDAVLNLPGWDIKRPIVGLPKETTGRSIGSNIEDLQKMLPPQAKPSKTCIMTATSDDAAFILNARGFHMPYSSAVLGYTCIIDTDIVLFLPRGSHECPVEIPPEVLKNKSGKKVKVEKPYRLQIVRESFSELSRILKDYKVDTVCYNAFTMNAFLPTLAEKTWPTARKISDFSAVVKLRAKKTEKELDCMRDAFLKSSRAIANTLKWLKASVPLEKGAVTKDKNFKAPISEKDLSDKISMEFLIEGAVELSFNSITSADENSAIIHYADASKDKFFKPGSMALLDCGAYFKEGYATDTTRTVFCSAKGVKPADWQKKIYTVTLKGAINCLYAELDRNFLGNQVDLYARNPVSVNGYEYNHGTGHGVGIHVHEGGISFRTVSLLPLTENAVVSIEPGIYLEGKGGVRIENIGIVKPHSKDKKKFVFENLCYVGYDWDLIDISMLTETEKKQLVAYEKKCQKLGTAVTKCPL